LSWAWRPGLGWASLLANWQIKSFAVALIKMIILKMNNLKRGSYN